jgi:hypothetical protein
MKIELFKDAVAIIRGIPEERFDLETWQTRRMASRLVDTGFQKISHISCNTIACAAGWLSLHPTIQARGMQVNPSSGCPMFQGHWGYSAYAKLFGITEDESEALFQQRPAAFGPGPRINDRDVWVNRALELLAKHEAKRERRQTS